MSISISGSIKMQAISVNFNAINTPNWELIPHKDMKTPSEDELIKQIKELAINRSEAVTEKKFAYVNHQEEKS